MPPQPTRGLGPRAARPRGARFTRSFLEPFSLRSVDVCFELDHDGAGYRWSLGFPVQLSPNVPLDGGTSEALEWLTVRELGIPAPSTHDAWPTELASPMTSNLRCVSGFTGTWLDDEWIETREWPERLRRYLCTIGRAPLLDAKTEWPNFNLE